VVDQIVHSPYVRFMMSTAMCVLDLVHPDITNWYAQPLLDASAYMP
jgi:hypothetical protein